MSIIGIIVLSDMGAGLKLNPYTCTLTLPVYTAPPVHSPTVRH
jgi:hypothetical protein